MRIVKVKVYKIGELNPKAREKARDKWKEGREDHGQVKEDMEKAKPMDRLICGDVGFGKTEVAIRAAFKAVMGGKQVAVLVPTTVLAQQHFVSQRNFEVTRVLRGLLCKAAAALSVFQSLQLDQVFQVTADLLSQHGGFGGVAARWRSLPSAFEIFIKLTELANQVVVIGSFEGKV
jgi:hypothetical protein